MAGKVTEEHKEFSLRVLITLLLVLLACALVYIISSASGVMLLVFLSILLGVLIDGIAGLLTKYLKFGRKWGVLTAAFLFLAIITGMSWLVGPRVGGQMAELIDRIPDAVTKLQESLLATSWGRAIVENVPPAEEMVPSGTKMFGFLTGIFSSTLNIITNLIIVFFIGIYLAITPELYINNLLRLLPAERRKKGEQIFHYCGRALKWWLVGRFSSMAIVGILTGIGLWIIGMDLALSLGIIAGLFSFIPFLGPILSFLPAFVIAFTQNITMVYYVTIVYLAVQTVESYLLTPLIDQRTVSIPPALLITMQLLMGVLFGALGIILASPFAVIVIILVQSLYVKGILGDEVAIMGDQSVK